MNLENLQRKLIAAARAARLSDRVPYAFEKRVMARLAEAARVDLLGAWSAALWRAAFGCLAVVALSAAFAMWTNRERPNDFSQEFETAVVASAGPVDDAQ
jgi:hypothetical protein